MKDITKVLVLGATGMLGSMLLKVGLGRSGFEVKGTVRNLEKADQLGAEAAQALISDVDIADLSRLESVISEFAPDVVINAVGLIKQRGSASAVLEALPMNSMFPHRLAEVCRSYGARLVQISTDCVFSGQEGMYAEADIPDARDVYGLSKYLGEIDTEPHITIRTSIIGPELKSVGGEDGLSLLDWFLSQSGQVAGYRGAIFSGLPTVEIASIIYDLVIPRAEMHGVWHVSAEPINKFDLLELIRDQYGRSNQIVAVDEPSIDRSLDSSRFRTLTGYNPPPWVALIEQMRLADPRQF